MNMQITIKAHSPPGTVFVLATHPNEIYIINMANAMPTQNCPLQTIFRKVVLGLVLGP